MSNVELTHIQLGDLLKWEASPLSRIKVSAPTGTKAGQLVDHPLRTAKLFALSNEENGDVLVQPHNCKIDLTKIKEEDLAAITGADLAEKLTTLATEGDVYGIIYIGSPTATPLP